MPRRQSQNVLRVAAGAPSAVFAPPWRFWTSGSSAYFAGRSTGGIVKASFHPADESHDTAVWAYALTSESGAEFEPDQRRAKSWPVPTESETGIYLGPVICIPRLPDRPYDLPSTGDDVKDLSDMYWVDPPEAGRARFLHVLLSDDRPGIEYFLAEGESVVGVLPMSSGWDASVLTWERAFEAHELAIVEKTRNEADIAISPRLPEVGTESASLLWITESPDGGRPMFVQIVLGSDNYHLAPGGGR